MADDPPSTPRDEAPRYTAQEWAALQARRNVPRYTPDEWTAMQAKAAATALKYQAAKRRQAIVRPALAVLFLGVAACAILVFGTDRSRGNDSTSDALTTTTTTTTTTTPQAATTADEHGVSSGQYCAQDRSRAGQCWPTAHECEIESLGSTCTSVLPYFCFNYTIAASGAAKTDCFMHVETCGQKRLENPDPHPSICERYGYKEPEAVDWGPQITPTKRCTTGCPCGDSCISCSKTCRTSGERSHRKK